MKCSICERENPELEHLPIYLKGSEGIEICPFCKMSLTEYLKGISSACSRTKMQVIKERKGEEK